jgi:hypothetical protein
VNAVQIRSAERALSAGTWLIVAGAMLYSILTVTPLAAAHTPKDWRWTAPILPLVVDAAVVIVVRLDATLARLGGHGGRWPVVLRWMTGVMTLALNVADSALKKDLVGVAVHAVAPLLLIVTAETGLAYRRAITAAQSAAEDKQRAERERREKAETERRERDEQREREEREAAERERREQREHELSLEREKTDRAERLRREEREREEARERAERAERERREREREQREQQAQKQAREAAERAERERREKAETERRERAEILAVGPASEKRPEEQARSIVAAAFAEGLSVRSAAELCGWSVGWVSSRYAELRDPGTAEYAIASGT